MRLLFLVLSVAVAAAEPWGPDLWPNSSFEDGIDGWTGTDAAAPALGDGCAGDHGLRAVSAPSQDYLLQSPVVPLSPGWYVLSFWTRLDRDVDKAPPPLVYVDRQTGDDAARRRDSVYFYYGWHIDNNRWELAFLTFRLRPGDTGLRLRFPVSTAHRSLDLDLVQVRRLLPPTGPGTVTSIHADGYGADRVPDPEGVNGFALRVAEGHQARGGKTGGNTRFTNPPGLYRVVFRFRQEAPGTGQVLRLRLGADSGSTIEDIGPEDFAGTDGYREFPVYSLYPFGTGTFPGWEWTGTGTYRFGGAIYERLLPLSHRQGWELLAPGVDVGKVLPAGVPAEGKQAWVAWGLYTDLTGIVPALDAAGQPAAISLLTTTRANGFLPAPPMPRLDNLRTVVLANIPSRLLAPAEQLALRRFVENGGTLVVSGGFYGYGHGGYAGSFLEEMLPVAIARTFDLVRVDDALRTPGWWFPTRLGGCAWVHDVTPKPGAEVRWVVGKRPGVVTWQFGRGRVVAVCATVLGTPPEPWWNNDRWPAVLAGLLATQPR